MRVRYNEVYLSSWTKEKQVEIWDFKGKEGNSQEDGKYLENGCFLCPKEIVGHREEF